MAMERSLLPNATPFPDVLTDRVMPLVSGDEWKVIHYGVRYALGHHWGDTLTVAQIAHGRQHDDGTWLDRGTGLSEEAVKQCLAFLCDQVHLFLREDRPRKPLGYRLNLDLSSINWAALEQRGQRPAPPQPPEKPPVTKLVEIPVTDVHLDMAGPPVLEQLQRGLRPDERQTLDYLLALAQKKLNVGQDDTKGIWQLYTLWKTFGFRRLQNALQAPGTIASLDDVNHACLVGTLAEALEAERFGSITPAFREQLMEMAREWPRLSDWQEAISLAVKINKRRLKTVETILKNKTAPPAPLANGDRHDARTATPAPGRRRPARRQSEWTADELRAGREADRDKDWAPPPD